MRKIRLVEVYSELAAGTRGAKMGIDAHADFHSQYTTPSSNMHSMPLAMVSAIDNEECESNDIEEETEALWERIKKIGGRGPKISPSDVVFIGVRDTKGTEDHILEKYGIKNFNTDEVNGKGVARVIEEALELLKECDQVYISFDVDSLDTSISVVRHASTKWAL